MLAYMNTTKIDLLALIRLYEVFIGIIKGCLQFVQAQQKV